MSSTTPHYERGFTLLEALAVLAIIGVIAAFAFSRFTGRDEAERLIQDAGRRVRERRAAAMRLNPLDTATGLENYTQPPAVIDFSDLNSTRPLVLDGTDSGAAPTTFQPPATLGGQGTWVYSYQGLALIVPPGWAVAAAPGDLGGIPEIDRGEFTSSVGFDAAGRPSPLPPPSASSGEGRFWAIYFVSADRTQARAIAVHATGLVEVWRYRDANPVWRGFRDRL